MNTARSSVTATSVHLGGPIAAHGSQYWCSDDWSQRFHRYCVLYTVWRWTTHK